MATRFRPPPPSAERTPWEDAGEEAPSGPPELLPGEFPGAEAPVPVSPERGSSLPPTSPTPPLGLPLPLMALVEQARREEPGERQRQLALRINQTLAKMASGEGGRPVADVFHRLIEGGMLEGLEDETGQRCLEAAVQGLLSLGFPYALEVRPEDLERLHAPPPVPSSPGLGLKPTAAAIAGGGAAGQVALELLTSGALSTEVTLQVGALLAALVPVLLSAPKTALRYGGLAVLLLVSVTEIFLGFSPSYAGLLSGLAGLVACLLIAVREG
ncbi:hypothetical protein [Stigmatella erecta]|uniref:Uncharacterized protein n=1 Tax=Stigmatella erecta TaxID=83460 RepID=A0A1I0JVB6_9BACT|nr:hypothetical protein [Stigmatella erecta]SEU14472.1 hypothetical protein SAMN05443639_108132 [Stigmatella erecta]